jgi:diaminopimelate epimerase
VAPAQGDGRAPVTELQFYKMTGSGNDFVVFDGRSTPARIWTPERIRAVCDRRHGVGADGLVILSPGDPGAVRMTYWNNDGSRGAMCGNAALCCTRLAKVMNLISTDTFCLLTDSGPVPVRALSDANYAEINLPDVSALTQQALPSSGSGEAWISFLRVGVPHLVIRVDDVGAVDVAGRGQALRSDPVLGQEGANVNFVSPSDQSRLWLIRTYERGVEGETLACGTGTAAAAAALVWRGEASFPVVLRSRGGLRLQVRGRLEADLCSQIWLSGEGRVVYRGVWESSDA